MSEIVEEQPSRTALRWLTCAFIGLVICTQIGSWSAPSMAKDNPEAMLALSSRMRHLFLSVPADISPFAYASIGFVRLLVAGLICYGLGRLVGDRLFRWFDVQSGGDRPATLRWIERAVHRAAVPLVFVFPGSNIAAFLVGRRRLHPGAFIGALAAGIAFRLWWIWVAAQRFKAELSSALDLIDRYQIWLIIGLVALSVIPGVRKAYAQEKARTSAESADVDRRLE
jgi:membrane protein DedA with SNARE-associated domain